MSSRTVFVNGPMGVFEQDESEFGTKVVFEALGATSAYTVVGGDPARFIRKRFDDDTIAKLMALKWWDLPDAEIRDFLPELINGHIDAALEAKWLGDTARKVIERLGK